MARVERKAVALLFVFLFLCTLVSAHDTSEVRSGVWYASPGVWVSITGAWFVGWCAFLLIKRDKFVEDEDVDNDTPLYSNRTKTIFFWAMITPIILVTLFIAGETIYTNMGSFTGGPVHWHADYEVWACGQRLDLVDPRFPRNKIGTPLFHEHNDDRIHVEGTVKDLESVDLGTYFHVTGGALENGLVRYPSEASMQIYTNGMNCADDSVGSLVVYVNGKQITDPSHYVPYPATLVPPGDCIIVEFGANLGETTQRICESWAAKGWTYDTLNRDPIAIGGQTWQ